MSGRIGARGSTGIPTRASFVSARKTSDAVPKGVGKSLTRDLLCARRHRSDNLQPEAYRFGRLDRREQRVPVGSTEKFRDNLGVELRSSTPFDFLTNFVAR